MKVKEYIDILIFFAVIFLIIFGLKFKPSLTFIGLIIIFTLPASFILKFRETLSKNEVLGGIFVAGFVINGLIGVIILQIKDIEIGMLLMSFMPLTLVLIPAVFATSLLLRCGASRKEAIIFYFWFLLSVGLAILFLLPTGHITTTNSPIQKYPAFSLILMYLMLILIPSFLCYTYKYLKTFLIFLPLPVILGYSLLFVLS